MTDFMRWYDWSALVILMLLGGWKLGQLGETVGRWAILKIEDKHSSEPERSP